MKGLKLVILSWIALVACGQETASPPPPVKAGEPAPTSVVTGREAYEQVCADCHASGRDGAPRTDHPEDWTGRSGLWQAVLYEHARQGYMAMPAKGGDGRLDDALVAAAAEYMLERTHPHLPRDQ